MFKIAICDDEATSLKLNRALTEKILNEEGISFEIQTFEDMREMTQILSNKKVSFDVLLSDILTTDMNGIEAAEELRKLGEKLDIIFISTTAEYALDGYRVQALRYLQKPVDIEKLREALLLSFKKHSNSIESMSVTSEGKMYNISYKDVVYIESDARDVRIVLKDNRVLLVHMKISDMEKMLPEVRFYRCHRSYIINLGEVENLERYQMSMKNKDVLPVSQQLYNETKKRYHTYNRVE